MAINSNTSQITKSKIRKVEWGKTYNWELCFPDAPEPFKDWFPASEVEEPMWNLDTDNHELYMSSFEMPKGTSLKDIKVTFYDDDIFAIHDWLKKWAEKDILNYGSHIGYLSEIGKQLMVRKFKNNGELLVNNSYYVFPKGSQYWNGNNDSSAMSSMVEFAIISGFWCNDGDDGTQVSTLLDTNSYTGATA